MSWRGCQENKQHLWVSHKLISELQNKPQTTPLKKIGKFAKKKSPAEPPKTGANKSENKICKFCFLEIIFYKRDRGQGGAGGFIEHLQERTKTTSIFGRFLGSSGRAEGGLRKIHFFLSLLEENPFFFNSSLKKIHFLFIPA